MPIDYTEKGFEKAIEFHLIEHGGYEKGDPANFDRHIGLDPTVLFSFILSTQKNNWEKLKTIHGDDVKTKFLDKLYKELDVRGSLEVIRHGLKDHGVEFNLFFMPPPSGMNPDVKILTQKNILTITRQVKYSTQNEKSIDVLLSVNGLPVATAELKNQLTGQNVEHAKQQYMYERDPMELLFQFKKRALVHFAIDSDEVYMTTRLNGKNTKFLPFNKGHNNGAGNPDNPSGYKTSYLWESVLTRDSWIDIISGFIQLETLERYEGGEKIIRENLIFPRYHQLDAVRKLVSDVKDQKAGKNYLIEHSAGSGKSNTIAWLAHRLSSLHNKKDTAVFDSVIVMTDRVALDMQLRDIVYQFEHTSGVVAKIDKDSNQLAQSLTSGKRIIITTIQKFSFILDKTKNMPKRKYAVIIDEAHSSQTGESSKAVKEVLSATTLEEAEKIDTERELQEFDPEEEILKSMQIRGRQENLSFFAFTATPKAKTLELFGTVGHKGVPEAFHLYSMRQAIEEGFILDVLQNYTTYKTYYKIAERAEQDKKVDKKKASLAMARFISLHEHDLVKKTEVIVEHLLHSTMKKIGGQAKAMLVTRSRLHAVRYKKIIDKYIADKKYTEIKTLVAFSGRVEDGGIEYQESRMNGFGEKQLPEKFNTREFQLLIVADKYQTGYDQPLLHTMYVDKRLSGIKAVQTLSRLNRTYAGKEDTFVLDFVNEPSEIQESFLPYYELTFLKETTDPNLLYDIDRRLTGFRIFNDLEIDEFCSVYLKPKPEPEDHGRMYAILDKSIGRFKNENDARKEEFKNLLVNYVRQYSFLAQIILFKDTNLEKLYLFSRFLIKRLPLREMAKWHSLGDDVALEYYRLEKISEGSLSLELGDGLKPPKDAGKRSEPEELVSLSDIIREFNKIHGNIKFTNADKLEIQNLEDRLISDDKLADQARNNPKENFRYPFREAFENKLIDMIDSNPTLFAEIMNDDTLKNALAQMMLNRVYSVLISPEKPFSNIMAMCNALKICEDYVHWTDKYFRSKGLEWLIQCLEKDKVKTIKILTSIETSTEEFRNLFKAFREEMKNHQITSELRIIVDPAIKSNIHDRWIVAKNHCFNVPSIDTIMRGQYSEIISTENVPPFDTWWTTSLDIITEWDKISKLKK